MFKKTPVEPTALDLAINDLYEALDGYRPTEEEYATIADQLVKLENLRKDNSPDKISYDAMVAAATNIIGLGMILHFEKVGVVTSKALSFVKKF